MNRIEGLSEGSDQEEEKEHVPEPSPKNTRLKKGVAMGVKRLETEPIWFTNYRKQAKKRHEEKMALKSKLLSLLEDYVSKVSDH